MTLDDARRILDSRVKLVVYSDGEIHGDFEYLNVSVRNREGMMTVDGEFTADELEALAVILKAYTRGEFLTPNTEHQP